jgi:hypothetical protein
MAISKLEALKQDEILQYFEGKPINRVAYEHRTQEEQW